MKAKHLIIRMVVGAVFLVVAAGIYAGTEIQDAVQLKTEAYSKHTQKIVVFEHKKHQADYADKYPELYESGCGECHHNENNEPLSNLKEGDGVQKCIECHKTPAYIKGKEAKKLSDRQKLEYHANALHANCKGCHKAFNKKFNKTAKNGAPTTCKKCHSG